MITFLGELEKMNRVTITIPKDRRKLQERYTELVAQAVAEMLNDAEKEYLLAEIERREASGRL